MKDALSVMNESLAKALAQKLDDDIIFGLNPDAIRWHRALMKEEIRKLKPKWMLKSIWYHIFTKG